jgi:hypothetical protein
MRMHAFLGLTLLFLASAETAIAETDGWRLTSGLHGGPDVGYVAKTTPPTLEIGTGNISGMTASQAVYLRGNADTGFNNCGICLPQESFIRFGGIERRIPLEAWHGKRIMLTVRLKNEGGAHGYIATQINLTNGGAWRTTPQYQYDQSQEWQDRQFVLQVPDDAKDLVLFAGLVGDGAVWLDDLTLKAASADVPATKSRRLFVCSGTPCEVLAYPDRVDPIRGAPREKSMMR